MNKIQKQHHNKNTRKFTFSYRVTSPWNALTPEIKRAHTTNAFKNRIDQHQIFTNIIMYDLFDAMMMVKNKQKLGLL